MNTIIKIYIYDVDTREIEQSNQNIEKSLSGKSSFKLLMCVVILYIYIFLFFSFLININLMEKILQIDNYSI